MRRCRVLALAMVCALGAATPVLAAQVTVSDGWFRWLPANLPAAGYFELRNAGKAAVSLTGAESPACGMLMLHKSNETGGMSSMAEVPSIEVPVGGAVRFAPGGYHLMCMNATAALKVGAKVPVTLKFSDGSSATATFAVKNARGQ